MQIWYDPEYTEAALFEAWMKTFELHLPQPYEPEPLPKPWGSLQWAERRYGEDL